VWRHITSPSCNVYTVYLPTTLLPTVVHIAVLMLHITAVNQVELLLPTILFLCQCYTMQNVTTSCLMHDFSAIFVFIVRQPLVGQDLLIFEASWSHWIRHTTLSRTHLDEWSAQCRDLSNKQHTTLTIDGHACPLQDSKPHSQQAKDQLFYKTEYHFVPDR